MDLLAQDFGTITFQDVVGFCDQKVVENTELDYKQVIPKDLTKHFAAMSNRYGGLIIVGVEEDRATGLPVKYDGIVNDGKQIDRVHQFANNVRPLPTYDVRTTDEVSGKVFLLIRVNEGGSPPYTSVNDPTVYLRTGNITTPLRPADADIVRDLYAKRANAEGVRRANVTRAKSVLLSMLEQGDLQRPQQVLHEKEPDGSQRFKLAGFDDNFRMLTAYLQPFYPGHELAPPRDIRAALNDVRVMNHAEQSRAFPSRYDVAPMARGMVSIQVLLLLHVGSDLWRCLRCQVLTVLGFEKPQAGSLHGESGEAGVGAGGVNLARGPASALACVDRVVYPVGSGHPAGTRDDQEKLVLGRRVGADGPAWLHRQAGDAHATAAGGDSGGMQPDAAVRADQTLVAVETEDLHACIFSWPPVALGWRLEVTFPFRHGAMPLRGRDCEDDGWL